MEDERSYYHIAWTAFGEDGSEKEVPLAITAGDDERVVLLFASFARAKRYMHTFLAKSWRELRALKPGGTVPVGGQTFTARYHWPSFSWSSRAGALRGYGFLPHYNGTIYRERKGGHVESRQGWGIVIGAFVGALLGGVLGRIAFGPGVGLYVGIVLGAAIGGILSGAGGRR
jgi:hypothetical protein